VEEQAEEGDLLTAVGFKGGKNACKGGADNGEILRRWYGPKAARSQAREERALEKQIHERRNGVVVAKVQTVEEQAEEGDLLTAVGFKGGKDACKGGADNGEIL